MSADGRSVGGLRAQTFVGISFGDVFQAREFMSAASGLASKGQLVLDIVVLIEKDETGWWRRR